MPQGHLTFVDLNIHESDDEMAGSPKNSKIGQMAVDKTSGNIELDLSLVQNGVVAEAHIFSIARNVTQQRSRLRHGDSSDRGSRQNTAMTATIYTKYPTDRAQ